MFLNSSWRRWLSSCFAKHRSCGICRRVRRPQTKPIGGSGVEFLEARALLDAAPYVVQLNATGKFELVGREFENPNPDREPRSYAVNDGFNIGGPLNITVVPESPYLYSDDFPPAGASPGLEVDGVDSNRDGDFDDINDIKEYIKVVSTAIVSSGFEHEDNEGPIGQPEVATVFSNQGTGAGFSTFYRQIDESTPELEPVATGTSTASMSSVSVARIRIWDADCPISGTPVTGKWTLTAGAFVDLTSSKELGGSAALQASVTIRYWRALSNSTELVLDAKPIVVTIPVTQLRIEIIDGTPVVVVDENIEETFSGNFDLTTGSEIEIEIRNRASARSNGEATIERAEFSVSNIKTHHVDVLDFGHHETVSGVVDPRWIAVEYEVTRPICYFDLELGSVVTGNSEPSIFSKFRISPSIINSNFRFRLADPVTGAIVSPSQALSVGKHLLLIDGDSPSLQSQFQDTDHEFIVVQEPGRSDERQEFSGFFQARASNKLVIRSDSKSEDEIVLHNSTVAAPDLFKAEFKYGSDTSVFYPTISTPGVVIVTAAQDDVVLAYPDFPLPIKALLGDGSDVFVGGLEKDTVYGGDGNDALLGEGWEADVTSLKGLFQDMLDLEFTLRAGLIPAAGAQDTLYGDDGDDFLLGGNGNDHLVAGNGKALIFGDSMRLTASVQVNLEEREFAASVDFVRSGTGDDTIIAGSGSTLIMGCAGADRITGNTSGLSFLFGNAGNDTITGQSSFDVIAGGDGDDSITGGGLLIGDSFAFDTFDSIDFTALKNGNLALGVKLTEEDSGDDRITGDDGFDFIVGGDGDDTIKGGNGLNIVFGDSFDLTLSVGFDFTEVFSLDAVLARFLFPPLVILQLFDVDFELQGDGADTYDGGSGTDVVLGGAGDDTLSGNDGVDLVVGGDGDDRVTVGNALSDFLSTFIEVGFGGRGNDVITGSKGPDYLESESGNDTFFGLDGNDRIYGGADVDTLYGGPGNDQLYGEGGDDQIFGEEGDDELFGGLETDLLDGGPGNNTTTEQSAAPILEIGDAVSFVEGQPAVLVAEQATLTDADSGVFLGGTLTVAITAAATADDILEIRHQGLLFEQVGIQGNQVLFGGLAIGAFTGGLGVAPLVVTLNERATPEATQALLRTVTFRNSSITPSTMARTISVTLDDGDGGVSTPVAKTIQVTDVIIPPGFIITESNGTTTVNEQGTTDSFTVVLTVAPQTDVAISVTSGDTNEATIAPSSLVFTASNWNVPQTVVVTGVNDDHVDGTQTTEVTIAVVDDGSDDAFDSVESQSVSVTTFDDDTPPIVTLNVLPITVAEASGTTNVTVTLSGIYRSDVTVDLDFGGTATNGDDYTRSASQVVIPAGQTSGTISLVAVQDALDESNETIVVDILAVTNGTESGTQQMIATINDDDVPPSVTLSKSAATIGETGGATTITATLSAVSSSEVTVNLDFSGTGTIVDDFLRSATQILIPAGSLSGSVLIRAVQDSLDETNETIVVSMGDVTNGVELGTQQVTARIIDNDATPSVTLSLSAATLREANGTATLTASLSAASGHDITIVLGLSGTAGFVIDYDLAATEIVIPAGDTQGALTLTTLPDFVAESNESVIIDILGVLNARELDTQQVRATIVNSPTVSLSRSSETIAEAGATTSITATLSAVMVVDVTVALEFNGSAYRLLDYSTTATQIVIPAGSTTRSVTLTTISDERDEPDETIGVAISHVTNATALQSQSAIVTITDDDAADETGGYVKIADRTNGGPEVSDDDQFGSAVASLGDLDGDGVTDLAVGASGASALGAVHVLRLNADSTVKSSLKIPTDAVIGPTLTDYDGFGSALAAVGDLDGDGIMDLAVGAPGDDTGSFNGGTIHLLRLNADGSVKSSTKIASEFNGGPKLNFNANFGLALTSLGDLDGDGVADLAVGELNSSNSYQGAVHVLLMNSDATVKSSRILSGHPQPTGFDQFGRSLAALGDLDGDGVTELAVGSFEGDTGVVGPGRGLVYVLFLNADGTVKNSVPITNATNGGPTLEPGDSFGSSLAAVGDQNGDGVTDLAVGADGDDAVYLLFLNSNGTASGSQKIVSPTLDFDDSFGSSVAFLGNVGGNDTLNLAIGAERDATTFSGEVGSYRGAVFLPRLEGGGESISPTLSNTIPDQSASEDAPFSFSIAADAFSDPDDTLAYSATNSDGAKLPRWLTFDGATRTFSGTPRNADVGTFSVKVTATDTENAEASDTFTIVVANSNDAPTVVSLLRDETVSPDSPFTFTFSATAFADEDAGDSLTYTASVPDGTALPGWLTFMAATRTFSGTLPNSEVGTLPIKVMATDRDGASVHDTVNLLVGNGNDAPTLTQVLADQTAKEDLPFSFQFSAVTFVDPNEGDVLTLTAKRSNGEPLPSWLTFAPTTRTFTGTPTGDDSGDLDVTVTATDLLNASVSDTFQISVVPVNDAPSFTKGANVRILGDGIARSLPGWASGISQGPAHEAGQAVDFQVTIPAASETLFAVAPAISSNGTLTYTPRAGATGVVTVTAKIHDDGGTENGGVDTSAAQTFTITLTGLNKAPSFAKGSNQTVNEDAGAQTINAWAKSISAGTGDLGQAMEFVVTNNNAALFSSPPAISPTGVLTFTPAANTNGTATVAVVLKDDGGTAGGGKDAAAPVTFTITVKPVNDVPIRTAGTLPAITVDEDSTNATAVPVGLTGLAYVPGPANAMDEAAQTLTFKITAIPKSLNLFKADGTTAVKVNGVVTAAELAGLKFKTVTNLFGAAPLTFAVIDSGSGSALNVNSLTETIDVTVNAINDGPPTISNIADQTTTEDPAKAAAIKFTVDDPDDKLVNLNGVVVTATSSNANLVPNSPAHIVIGSSPGSRTIQLKPALDQVGTTTVTVTATDSSGATATDTFVLTVTAVNDAPRVTIATLNVPEFTTNDTVVGTVAAVDPEGNVVTSFMIAGGNTGNAFKIDSATGVIRVNDATKIDFEALAKYTLTIKATDALGAAGTKASETGPVTINVENQSFALTVAALEADNTVTVSKVGNNLVAKRGLVDAITPTPLEDVTSLTINGGSAKETVILDASLNSAGRPAIHKFTGQIVVNGNAGDDKLDASKINVATFGITFDGGAGNDTALGGAGHESLSGGEDNDLLKGGKGNDSVNGGGGNDAIFGDDGDDQLVGNAGNDTIIGGAGNDLLHGNSGDDTLIGGLGADQVFGDEDTDIGLGGKGGTARGGNGAANSGDVLDASLESINEAFATIFPFE